MPKRGMTQDWRVRYHYTTQRVPVFDEDGYSTGEWIHEPRTPLSGVQVVAYEDRARRSAQQIVELLGWAEVYYVPPESARTQKSWVLVAQYPPLGAAGVTCLRCGAELVPVDEDFRITGHAAPAGGVCDGEHAGLSREDAAAVVVAVRERFGAWIERGSEPRLYDHVHEGLRAGSFSIGWEGGPRDWALAVVDGGCDAEVLTELVGALGVPRDVVAERLRISPIAGLPHVFLEPINSFTLGVYPA
ncbi:hypothetical protein [Nocardia sp. NPDC050435]|uniref:hypothetical protein n=1 Tax=Nocardia sp. NPDC050435 TaxID=3155040 RepID=UPI0033D4A029